MEISSSKLESSLISLKKKLKNDDEMINKFLLLKKFTTEDVEKIYKYLNEKILEPKYTENIGTCFIDSLLLIVSTVIKLYSFETPEEFSVYQTKCIALSKLITISPDILKYASKYFVGRPPPFQSTENDNFNHNKRKKLKKTNVTDIEILKCCYNLLSSDINFYKDLWNWSELLQIYFKKGTPLQRIYCNHIIAILTNMTEFQIKQLNVDLPQDIDIQFDEETNKIQMEQLDNATDNKLLGNNEKIVWNFKSDVVINIEGVFLPIYDNVNSKFYQKTDGNYDKIVKVKSTKMNLRSICLGVSSGKAICISGPVGCGKTTLIEYIARKTGRVFPKKNEMEIYEEIMQVVDVTNKNTVKEIKKKRKYIENIETNGDGLMGVSTDTINQKDGFLRIQLGDQTDSKMLLGQYRCTDVPGEFVWLPGVLTQAVMNGCWLLLEDLDSATQDTFTILSNLLENNSLSVPGFRDCVKIEPGFQLFVTTRSIKSTNHSQKSLISLLEKYLYTINIIPLSRNELCQIISANYPKLKTVANRIVDVYLTFSSGDHSTVDNLRNVDNKTTENNSDDDEKYIALPFEKISLSNLVNSGRLVSTRDLMKLCHRSNPTFSATSTECAYFVFQNAVDVLCSYLPHGPEKTKLITSIGAKIGIIHSRCDFYANDYKPELFFNNNTIKVGRAEIQLKSELDFKNNENTSDNDSDTRGNKKIKLSKNSKQINNTSLISKKVSTFSFTRMTLCLLERISVCVAQNEPILLVGETGVGKTSSVQYLAQKTQHKLVVVNMNNQSDVSDLVGGFKPVDLKYVIAPLRSEFEQLFRKTFNENKNEKFLNNISICYNQENFQILIKLMIKIAETVFERADNNLFVINNQQEYLKRWRILQTKILKLNSQLQKSINISFAFIPGSLVNCIKKGDWVLLDEINLASAETLECLSTILEPDGSVVLLEKGDFTPVQRHPNFRIFACMNPNTDIGKKDLPVGIRNRFTEFFVDEITAENDLMLLINDYLTDTGIKKTKVLDIVKLYKKLKTLSQLELNDGLGNRPVFSLRTLCRSLMICAKNLCGSIERNLYESFCLSFLTQLDPISHKLVLELIKAVMLTNAKAILSQGIPKPGNNYINFEGYWIEQGPKEINVCENYILTEGVKQNLKDLARIISIGKLPILLQGPTSAGKTSLIEYVAKKSGNHCLRINNHEHTDLQEYIGSYTADVSGKLSFKEGVLVQAMRNGFWIILDELNLASTDILEALNRVLDDNRELFIPETQTVVKAHPNFMLFATQNPPGLYGGRKTLSRAFKNRFIELHFSDIPNCELEIILEKRCLIPKSYSQKMVSCMSDLQANRKTTSKNNFTLRDLFRWGNRYTYADKTILDDNKYDWNQHLVDEGYLVLSAKVRTNIEVDIIEEALYKHFRKKICITNLFSLTENVSMVTKNILESIYNYKCGGDIVWTQNMTRMAVLTAKALQFNEPVLLVGPTGCGKTTICQILAKIKGRKLRILNCHMHTEGADFLGGLRPFRKSEENKINDGINERSKKQLFEWSDGPLVISMQDGNFFMADEISLAEDSVLERLNSILEPERTLLLAEKGGISGNVNAETLTKLSKDFVVQAHKDFNFFATMNPGGDFGKKELSPALRNRFTEIWCKPSDDKADLIEIAANCLNDSLERKTETDKKKVELVATVIINIVFYLQEKIEKFKFSVRDIFAWSNYLIENSKNKYLQLPETLIFGLETIFLDSLEMLPHESIDSITKSRQDIIKFAIEEMKKILGVTITENELESLRGIHVEFIDNLFGIKPFFIERNMKTEICIDKDFLFEAPTTKDNLSRLLSALSLKKAILLEGPPGVGKTSIVESLAKAIGYKIVRINLCEHTDLADLFGTDLPAEEKALELNIGIENKLDDISESSTLDSFVWRDGPLLAALKSENTWILLDELNLAPQSVLEGLNAILDHRGEVFIPELNKTFLLGERTRIFACQNPLRQGGGRKGLPQSFLNRFTKVFLRTLKTEDLLFVLEGRYSKNFQKIEKYFLNFFNFLKINENYFNLFDIAKKDDQLNDTLDKQEHVIEFNLAERMVRFSEILDQGISNLQFGYRGGPFEINLRDILRWCDLLVNDKTGFVMEESFLNTSNYKSTFKKSFNNFLLVLYERMKLVYYHRMRSEQDQIFIRNAFSTTFNCDADKLNTLSEDIGLYWTDSAIYLNDIIINRNSLENFNENENILRSFQNKENSSLLLGSQRECLKSLIECVHMEKPVILCGSTDTGKTKIIDVLCRVSNQICNVDTIDDSVTGSFQQIDLNRHLEEISQNVECIMIKTLQKLILINQSEYISDIVKLFNSWNLYSNIVKNKNDKENSTAISNELIIFRKRVQNINEIIQSLIKIELCKSDWQMLINLRHVLNALNNVIKNSDSLNTGGHFEWVDSKIVKSIKSGQYICLEHVNLCSSAVLDRLNPIFEPNGTLLISEKGVTAGDEAEIVKKHKNFRAFLTLDPKNGELSRAMRNRCIELAITKDVYTNDDLKMIIYKNGVHQMHLINGILSIDKRIKTITDMHNFNISHLTQFAFLVSSYIRIGYSDEKAIFISGLEVYVYSSNTDLLGYGLKFYQNKLRDIVLDGSKTLTKNTKINNFKNIMISCENLNIKSMVKLQCEPIFVLLNHINDTESAKEDISNLFDNFKTLNFENNLNLIKYFIYIIYESSTFEDLTYRYKYLNKIFESLTTLKQHEQSEIILLNNNLFGVLKSEKNLLKNSNENLPWNTKLFTRIRDYKNIDEVILQGEQQMSLLLVNSLLIETITNEKISKLSQITPMAYSQAINLKIIGDTANNVFLKHLSPFVKAFQSNLIVILRNSVFNMKTYVNTIIQFLWFNRFYSNSKSNKLFIEKSLNSDTMDKLLLHFNWIDKNLLKFLEELRSNNKEINSEFDISLQKIRHFSLSVNHPLNLIQKFYFKKCTNFDPFYSEDQINLDELKQNFENQINLVPHFGHFETEMLLKKYSILWCDETTKVRSILTRLTLPHSLKPIRRDELKSNEISKIIPEHLRRAIQNFNEFQLSNKEIEEEIDFNKIKQSIEVIKEKLNECQELQKVTNFTDIEMLSLKEYFLLRSISYSFCDSSTSHKLNKEYYEDISSLKCENFELLEILNTDEFKNFNNMWKITMECITRLENVDDFEDLIKCFTSLEYRNFTTFYRIIMHKIQTYQLSSISNRSDCCLDLSYKKDKVNSDMEYNGPPLTNTIVSLLFKYDGEFKPIALSDIDIWKKSLKTLRQTLWNNSMLSAKMFDLTNCNLKNALLYSQKILYEIQFVQKLCQNIENKNFSDYNENFEKLVKKLKEIKNETEINLKDNNLTNVKKFQKNQMNFALINTLVGSIELCLLSFTPLIDPVEKNHLKNKYISEDLNCLTTLTNVYDFMKIIMKYNQFGSEIYLELEEKINYLENKKKKYGQKVALRSENCIYGNLVKDIKHFLNTNCNPNTILSLINVSETCLCFSEETKISSVSTNISKTNECIKMIEIWIANSQRFVHHTLKKYSTYFKDFVQPIECSITMTRYGLESIKSHLTQLTNSFVINDSGFFRNLNENSILINVLENIAQFPSVLDVQLFENGKSKNLLKSKSNVFTVLDRIDQSEFLYFTLLKAKLIEIKNRTIISSEIDNQTFYELDTILNISNQIWQEEEERRRKKITEEESLYVNKTLCKDENLEELELLEVQENFPTFVEEDFGEFMVEDTLEKVIKLSNINTKKVVNVIEDDDFKLLGENIIFIMEQFSRNYYNNPLSNNQQTEVLNFVSPFKDRIKIFVKLFNHYKFCLNELVDENLFNSYGFTVGIQQELVNEITITLNSNKVYNFYKDSNIPVVITCIEVLDETEQRVQQQLNLYPDHATLNDIIKVIQKIRSLPSTSSVVRFNTGFQILRQKISLWNEVAHKNNHMKDLELRVAEFVQCWTKLELQFWRNCLSQTYEKVETNTYKYWFFIYNLLHEYLEDNQIDSSLMDFKMAEKRFEEGKIEEIVEEKTHKISSSDIIRVLEQFIESSNYGDFQIRMRLLNTFQLYLHYIQDDRNNIKKQHLISILRNLHLYFDQFTNEIEETKISIRTPIEKKVKEFVKIESYNKDLSYFSMRNNVARVHRSLNKFLKEYELQLKNKITDIFQQKPNLSKELNIDIIKGGKNLRYESKIKYYMIDVKNFLASQKLKTQCCLQSNLNHNFNEETINVVLMNKLDKLFITSINVCKQVILHAEYPNMIYSLDILLTEQIETCDYLRKLEVDRSQERPKQKVQAKSILQQKRKSLSDFFKILAKLGINYKTGLMEQTLKSEFIDYEIAPFCIKSMLLNIDNRKHDQNLMYLSENLDNYFAKCIFKLRQLKNAMIKPQSELGPPNIERIKGFAVDMFILIQNQRKLLSSSIKEIFDLRSVVTNITNLFSCAEMNNFDDDKMNFSTLDEEFVFLKAAFAKIQYVFEQFVLLLKCLPENETAITSALEKNNSTIYQNSEKYSQIIIKSNKIIEITKKNIIKLLKLNDVKFLNFNHISELLQIKEELISEISKIREELKITAGEYLPISKALTELLKYLNELAIKYNQDEKNKITSIENIDTELENIVHSILLSMQKLYKKFSNKELNIIDESNKTEEKTGIESSMQDNLLKQKIYKEILTDMETLSISSVLVKIENIFLSIKYTENLENKRNYVYKIFGVLPILKQFSLLADYFVFQQLGAHKVSTKMLAIMLTVFNELATKGFCVPADLMQDEEGEAKKEKQKGGGFGLEDGTGENDVSDKIENEDQLDDAKKPEDRKKESDEKNEDCKEEKGIEMSEDFDANLQDVEKPEDDDNENENSDDNDDLDKEMGDTEPGAEKLDDQIWGSDEEKEQSDNEDEMNEEENGKGNKDESDQHNDLNTKNEKHDKNDNDDEQNDGLDANNDQNSQKEKKKQEKDINDMQEPEVDEDQVNPYHNELEEPPEPEDMDLGENFNLDEDNAKDNDNENGENPFDIDKMKENMETNDEENNETESCKDEDEEKNEENCLSDSEEEPEAGNKRDEENDEDKNSENDDNQSDNETTEQTHGDYDPEKNEIEEEKEEDENPEMDEKEQKTEKLEQSKDKPSMEENVQSFPEEKNKGSCDQVKNQEKNKVEQDQDMDAQDTGEDRDAVGQADNETAEKGHQGIADTKETKSSEEMQKNSTKDKKKPGKTNEDRTLGEIDNNKTKQLKTIDKLKDQKTDDNNQDKENDDKSLEAEEYQHVKETKETDRTTLDNATETQSKHIQHFDDEEKKEDDDPNESENIDDKMDIDNEDDAEDLQEIPDLQPESFDKKTDKPSKSEKIKEKCEVNEKIEVEGEKVETMNVQRNNDTTAHCIKEILLDNRISHEPTAAETLEMRKLYQNQLMKTNSILPDHENYESWQFISNKMLPNARDLCEQLRLILEPTKCTRLKGDYRTGRRINMKKIIPYIASQFRKDKIWLRRTKPAQRDYKITIAIDDSKSMHHNNSKTLTLEAISLVSQALTLLESGKLSIISFGETPQIILNHTEQFDGPKLMNSLNFEKNQSRIAELLDFTRTINAEEGSSGTDNGIFENLLLVLSDGRNIYSEGEQNVKRSIKLARLQRMFLVYIIIDNPENKHSILDIRVANFSEDRKSITMKSYLDAFPFPYYVIVRDLGQLPIVLSEAMRQWFELVNSEQ